MGSRRLKAAFISIFFLWAGYVTLKVGIPGIDSHAATFTLSGRTVVYGNCDTAWTTSPNTASPWHLDVAQSGTEYSYVLPARAVCGPNKVVVMTALSVLNSGGVDDFYGDRLATQIQCCSLKIQ